MFKFILLALFTFALTCTKSEALSHCFADLRFDTDSLCSFHSFTEYSIILNDMEYLVRLNADINSIDFYNLQTFHFDFRIKLPFYSEAFYVKSLDSIFVMEYEINILHLIDKHGNIHNTYNFDSKLSSNDIQYVVYASTTNMLTVVDDIVVFNIVANTIIPDYYNFPTIGIYRYKTNQDVIKICSFPDFMRKGDIWFSLYPNYCINNESQIIASFPVDHNLYVFDLMGNNVQNKAVKSKYIESFKPIDKASSYNRKKKMEYEVTRNRYSALIFDKYRNIYYRVVYLSQKLTNSDGSVNEYGSNPWYLMLIDKDLNIIDEIKFEGNKHNPDNLIISKQGLMIQKNEENTISDKHLEYTLMKLGK